MRIHTLEIEGFGPFRDRQRIDFDEFAAEGIYLIAGRTGAGKSSILDAICFALYGGVPRYEGGDKRLRSDHCRPDDPTEVRIEFTARDERWRVTRSPEYERPKRRGDGLTTEPHRALLERLDPDGWTGVASRPVDVANELDDVLQLNQQQFLQVILLAQNRFARFLLAKNDERQALLRTLFGTRRFEDYERALDRRRREAEERWIAASESVAVRLSDARALIDAAGWAGDESEAVDAEFTADDIERAVQRAVYRLEALERDRDTFEQAIVEAERVRDESRARRERQRQRDRSRAELDRLEGLAADRDRDRATLAMAQRAESLRHVVESADAATTRLDAALVAEAEARSAWAALSRTGLSTTGLPDDMAGVDPTDGAALEAFVSRRTRDLGAWDEAAAIEAGLDALIADQSRATKDVALAEQRAAELDKQRRALPVRLAEIDVALSQAGDAAAPRAALEARAVALRAQLAAAQDAAALASTLIERERDEQRANDELAAAVAAVAELYRRRHAGMAGELAADLADGEPCAVCGALEHPSPAERRDDSVDPVDLESAESRRDAAMARVRSAGAATSAIREQHAAAVALSEGRAADEVETDLRTVRAELDAAAEAEALRAALAIERETTAAAAAELETARDDAARAVAQAREVALVADERLAAARRSIDEARGDHARVADRIAAVAAQIEAGGALLEAHRMRAAAEKAAVTVAAERDAALADSGFEEGSSVTAALRDDLERADLDERIRAHDVARERARATLLELELEVLPDEPIDLAPLEQAVLTARAQWQAAVAIVSSARSDAERLREILDRVAADGARVAERHAEFQTIDRLSRTVSGRAPNTLRMSLETFVLAAELEEIVDAANLRLSEMSAGRYRLRHTDALASRGAASGLGIEVMDAFTGQSRPAQSLSGGETFLASLALALGLAEVVTSRAGGVRLDTLFIDEGFGSLDAETLDTAMRTLDELRQGGRTVGVISHVEAMKDQILGQIRVVSTPGGPSVLAPAEITAGA